MRIDSTFSADLSLGGIRYWPESNLRTALVQLTVTADENKAKKIFGQEFAAQIFSLATIHQGEGEDEVLEASFAFRALRPASICENHKLILKSLDPNVGKLGTWGTQPELINLKPVKGRHEIEVKIRCEVELANQAEAGALAYHVGEVVEVQFKASQMELALSPEAERPTIKKKNGAFGNPQPVAV